MLRKNVKEVKRLKEKELSAIFLIFLMLLTPFTNVHVFGNFMQQPKVFTQSFVKTVEIEGKKFELQGFSRVTQYSNGTKLVEVSITIENVSEHLPRLRINLTKIITPEELQAITKVKQSPITSSLPITSSSDEYASLPRERWDNIVFVLAPGNEYVWVKYDHDDNYVHYYPEMWNHLWEIPIGEYGNQKIHTHMAVSDVYDWYTETKSDEEIMEKYVKGTSLGIRIIGAVVAGYLTYAVGGLLGILLAIIASALAQIWAWLLELLGITNKAQWIQDVVQAEQGDGFFWTWGFHTTYLNGIIFRPPIIDIYSRSDIHRLLQHHRVGILFYQVREFYRTWGANRDSGSETYKVELWYKIWVPPGVFGTSADEFCWTPW